MSIKLGDNRFAYKDLHVLNPLVTLILFNKIFFLTHFISLITNNYQ